MQRSEKEPFEDKGKGRKKHLPLSARRLRRSRAHYRKRQEKSKNAVENELLKLHQGSYSADEQAASTSACNQGESLSDDELRRILESSDEEEVRLDATYVNVESQPPMEVREEEPSTSREAASLQESWSILENNDEENFVTDEIASQLAIEDFEARPSTSTQDPPCTDDEELVVDSNPDAHRIQTVETVGRRVVDIDYLMQDMHDKFDNHSAGFDCSFANLTKIGSKRHGLITEFIMQCRMCSYKASVWSEPPTGSVMDLNHSAVAGALTTGIGYSQFQEMFAAMNIPCMSQTTYQKYHTNVAVGFKEAAEKEMSEAAAEERRLAEERGDFIQGIPHIPVVADGSWMKRSYRTGKYNSPSGVGAILGYRTKKVLFIGVRNKYCSVCENAVRRGEEPMEHYCFKNWGRNQSSTSMESDAIVSGFECSIEMHGLIYSTLIGDGDSSVYSAIKKRHPYSLYNYQVRKVECTNHLLRNLTNKIKEISKTKGLRLGGELRTKIENSGIRMRNAIVKAAEYRSQEKIPTTEQAAKLQMDISNIPSHVFGEHKNCAELAYFCDGSPKEDETDLVPLLQQYGLYMKIQNVLTYTAAYADSLLYNLNSNYVESYNAVICKLIGGKRINFAKRGSYQARCDAAVTQFNTQESLSNLSIAMGKEPPTMVKQMEEKRKRKIRKNAEAKRLAKRQRFEERRRNIPDADYGPNAEKPDMEQAVYDIQLQIHQRQLQEWQENREHIERQTVEQIKSEMWKAIRCKILTASNFGKVCRMRESTSCQKIVKVILYPQLLKLPAIEYGRRHENDARKALEEELGITIQKCGLFIDKEAAYLGASPDGLIGNDGIVEIKCLFSAKDKTPEEAIDGKIGNIHTMFKGGNMEKINTRHVYYYQVQGQLHITGRQYCIFCIWTAKGIKHIRIVKDDMFWNRNMDQQLKRFYENCMVPEIIDSRVARNMPIREPEYILKAQEGKRRNP